MLGEVQSGKRDTVINFDSIVEELSKTAANSSIFGGRFTDRQTQFMFLVIPPKHVPI